MRYLLLTLLGPFLLICNEASAQSNLLETVKRNPKEAKSLCQRFRSLNAQGVSASSEQAIIEVATNKNLDKIDAEILSMYVIGLNCPDVQ